MPLHVLVGKNTFERFQAEQQLAGPSPRIVRAPELAPSELPNLLLGETLFGPPQPLVLRDSDEATALQPLLVKLLDEPREDVVILSQNTLDNRTAFAKWLKQHADVQQFPLYNEKNAPHVA